MNLLKTMLHITLLLAVLSCTPTPTNKIIVPDTPPEVEPPAVSVIKFGLIADIQYPDKPDTGRYYRMSLEKLEESVAKKVRFTVNLGDLVDEDTPKNLGGVLTRLNVLDSVVYNTTGNHDYGKVTDNTALYEQLDMPAEYYSFTAPGWRFIMLNTNEISEYANPTPEETVEFGEMRQKMQQTGRRYASYNGGISRKQRTWREGVRSLLEPMQEDASMYSRSLIDRTLALTVRAYAGVAPNNGTFVAILLDREGRHRRTSPLRAQFLLGRHTVHHNRRCRGGGEVGSGRRYRFETWNPRHVPRILARQRERRGKVY